MNVTVLGAGAWGTALARLLHESKQSVTFWGHDPQHLEDLTRAGVNERYLPGVPLPRDWRIEADLARAIDGSECVIVAVLSLGGRGNESDRLDFREGRLWFLRSKNIQNTRIYAQISHPLREQVFRDLERHPKIVRIA